MLNKNPDRRPGISQIIQTKLITKYVKSIIGYGRTIKFQVDDLKKGFEELAADEAAFKNRGTIEDQNKSKKEIMSSSKSVKVKKDDKKDESHGIGLVDLKKKKEGQVEEEKKGNPGVPNAATGKDKTLKVPNGVVAEYPDQKP